MASLPHPHAGHPLPFKSPDLLCLHRPETAAQHVVQFYDNDSAVVENVSFLAAQAFRAGNSSVVVATDRHLQEIGRRLEREGFDLAALRLAHRYLALDAAETISQLVVNGCLDHARFDDVIGGVIGRAAASSADGFVFAFGEMVGLLCAANNPEAAVVLEQFWNALAERYPFSLYCAYSLSSLGPEPNVNALMQICAEHVLTIPAEINR